MKTNENQSQEDVLRHQTAVLVMCGAQLLLQASQLEATLHDPIIKAISIVQESLRPLAEMSSEEETVFELAEIIKQITNNLTGDAEKDSKYLLEQIEKYRHHEYAVEVLKTIGRIFYRFLPEERKSEVSNILKKEAIYTQLILSEAKSQLAEHNLAEAEKLVLGILPKDDLFQSDGASQYYDFKHSLEWAYFVSKNRPSKEIIPPPVSYNDVFKTYAYILVEKADYDNAIRIIDIGLKRNPLFIDLMFEKASIHRTQERHDEGFQISHDCFDIAYRRVDIARCYRDFGYYFIEKKNWDAAICCYMVSTYWFETEMAKGELYFITQQTRKIIDEEYYSDNVDRILQENGVPLKPNPLWIEMALHLGESMVSKNNIEDAKFCYHVAYELTGKETFHERILELNKSLQ